MPHWMKLSPGCLLIFVLWIMEPHSASAGDDIVKTAAAIRYESTLPENSPVGRPLPLAAHWNSGERKGGFGPDYQLAMIAEGHYLLPWFHLPTPDKAALNYSYYRDALQKAAELQLPISFISTQWERILGESPNYVSKKSADNPNVVGNEGIVHGILSPFGPEEAWYAAGRAWTARDLLERFQEWYPKPPLVVFVSNNEQRKLSWHELDESARFKAAFSAGIDDVQRRQIVGDAWIKLYRQLQQGMLDGLTQASWKSNSLFVGYTAFGGRAFGRWPDWDKYSLHVPGRFSPWPLAWDGASVPYYVDNWNSGTDFTVRSPQIEGMNWLFMLDDARAQNPELWFEISTWDGQAPTQPDDKKRVYQELGQSYGPERYEGDVQFGMWLLQPRVVREFRNHLATLDEYEPYFRAVVAAVDRVHKHPILRKFWRQGQLVANSSYQHPYQSKIPIKYQKEPRWFLLNTDRDPQRPWNISTSLPVFALARQIGVAPEREWLVYAHSPLEDFGRVKVDIPDYRSIAIMTRQRGIFYHVTEKGGGVNGLF